MRLKQLANNNSLSLGTIAHEQEVSNLEIMRVLKHEATLKYISTYYEKLYMSNATRSYDALWIISAPIHSLKSIVNSGKVCEATCYYYNDINNLGTSYCLQNIHQKFLIKKEGTKVMKKQMETFMNDLIYRYEDMVYEYGKKAIKDHFGRGFLYKHMNRVNSEIITAITNEYIKKYDKNFSKHVSNLLDSDEQKVIANTQFMIVLDKRTFMYVATGNKIQNMQVKDEDRELDMYLYIFGKCANKYIRELRRLIKKVTEKTNDCCIYNVNKRSERDDGESLDVLYNELPYRSLNTLFYSHNEKEIVYNHVAKFIESKEFYKSKELLYKTGILLYGKPGTGKSSLVKALACTFKCNIVNVNVSNLKGINLDALTKSINIDSDECRYIILLEDIDTLFLNRVDGESDKDDQAVINKLLQFLDSNSSPNNVIFIATTNHIDRLDEALLRAGRFDLKVEIQPLKEKEAIDFCRSFEVEETKIPEILNSFETDTYNQSSLQAKILQYMER